MSVNTVGKTDWHDWHCPKCGQYVVAGAYHYCESVNCLTTSISRETEILERLDRIIELLNRLVRNS